MKIKPLTNLLFLSPLLIILNCSVSPSLQKKSPLPISSVSDSPIPVQSSSTKVSIDNSEKIAFMSNRSGFWDIYTMNTDGSNQIKLTNDDMKGPFAFSVSPDGKKLAYISDKSGNPDLWAMDIESKETVQITNTELVDEGSPTWSSDNQNIAFHSNVNKGDVYQILQVSYPVTNNLPEFKILLAKDKMNFLHPAFSPNGTGLLYSLTDPNGVSILHIYDNLKKKDFTLTKEEDQAINGSWSPDSNKIIYWTNGNGLFQINLDGTDKTQLGTIKNIKGTPFFSPDGTKFIISRGSGFADNFDVWVIDNDGRNPQKLTTLGGLSLGWVKKSGSVGNNTGVPDQVNSPVPVPTSTNSGMSYLDPNDPLINPYK